MKTLEDIEEELSDLAKEYATLKAKGQRGRADLRHKAQVLCWVIGRHWEKHKSKFTG